MSSIWKPLAVVTIALTALVALPAAASADPTPVGIGLLRADPTDRGLFAIPAWTDANGAALNSVTARIRDGATEVTTIALTGSGGLWSPAVALKLTEDGGPMPHLGDYAVDVTATDSVGNTLTRLGAGTLDYTLEPEFGLSGLTFPDAPLSRTNPGTRIAGTLVGRQPGSGDLVPLDGRQVSIVVGPDAPITVSTGTDGSFTSARHAFAAPYYVTATVHADDAEAHGTATTSAEPPETMTDATIEATASPARVEPGHRLHISGTVREDNGAVLGGVAVRLAFGNYPQDISWTVTTDTKGRFDGYLPAISGPYPSWTADVIAPYVAGNEASGIVVVPNEGAFTGTRITLAPNGRVTGTGTLTTSYGGWIGNQDQSVWLQYSKDGRTGWKSLARGTDYLGTAKSISAWGYVAGYYRLYHPTSDDVAATTSTPVRLSRIPTRIAGNNATPEPVRSGATITVTGTLEQRSGPWRAMANQPIALYFVASGAKSWSFVASGRTDKHGHGRLRGQATRNGKWLLQYFGDPTHFDSTGLADTVAVR